jgi:hypothetical protein
MQMKYSKANPGLAFIARDATQNRWPSEIADVIVDKGTLQSLLLLRDGVERVEAFAREMWRILRPGGRMIQIMGIVGMQLYLKLATRLAVDCQAQGHPACWHRWQSECVYVSQASSTYQLKREASLATVGYIRSLLGSSLQIRVLLRRSRSVPGPSCFTS